MEIKSISEKDKEKYNGVVSHPLQSYEWGEFREKSGIKVVRQGSFQNNKLISAFQLTIHPIPKTPWTIGYLPKGNLPTKELIDELIKIGKQEKCIFIQLEPNVISKCHPGGVSSSLSLRAEGQDLSGSFNSKESDSGHGQNDKIDTLGLVPAAHPLFTQYTFILDLTKNETELLAGMHSKARYNIKVAQKHDVKVIEDNSPQAFEEYLKLTKETTTRQGFFAHTPRYHKLMWETLKKQDKNGLSAHLFTAKYQGKTLVAWILFVFKDTLYYPYGASSSEYREVMASNLIMWEAIRYGKKLDLKKFDMWGAMGPNPDVRDPWFGFHNFKQKYSPEHVEFIGSYDLVINPILYNGFKIADKLRWLLLRIKK